MIDIIYENDDFVAINKPAGMLVHRPERGPKSVQEEGVLTDWIKDRYPETKEVGDPSTSFPQSNSGRAGQANLRPGDSPSARRGYLWYLAYSQKPAFL